MSERITWVRCPTCGGLAAVGWVDDEPVEYDCPAGCPPLLAGPEVSQDGPQHLLAWAHDLCDRSGWLVERARSACARSSATVQACRASRRTRWTGVDSGRRTGVPRSPRQRHPGGVR